MWDQCQEENPAAYSVLCPHSMEDYQPDCNINQTAISTSFFCFFKCFNTAGWTHGYEVIDDETVAKLMFLRRNIQTILITHSLAVFSVAVSCGCCFAPVVESSR